jgi:hypothetical protein
MSEFIRNQGARTNPLMSRLNPRNMKGSRGELADLVRAALLATEVPDDEIEEVEVEDYQVGIASRRGLAQTMRDALESSPPGLNQLSGSLRTMFPGSVIDGRNY